MIGGKSGAMWCRLVYFKYGACATLAVIHSQALTEELSLKNTCDAVQ